MIEIIWTDPALAHLEAIRLYLEQFNPRAARQLADSLVAAGNSGRLSAPWPDRATGAHEGTNHGDERG